MQATITIGDKTTHGGVVTEVDSTFLVQGKAAHLQGMKHFCPKCKTMVSAIASNSLVTINGKAMIVAGDKTTCGATFIPAQNLVGKAQGSGSGSSIQKNYTSNSSSNSFVEDSELFKAQFEFKDELNGAPLSDYYYILTLPNGEKIENFTGNDGKTMIHEIGYQPAEVKIETFDLSKPMKPFE